MIADQEQPCSSTAAQDRATQSPALRRTPRRLLRQSEIAALQKVCSTESEPRLEQVRARRKERLASESAEERAARLCRCRVGSLPPTKNTQHSPSKQIGLLWSKVMERRYGQKIDRCVKLRHTSILDRHTAILDRHTSILDRHTTSLDRHTAILDRSSHRDPRSTHRDPRAIVTPRSSIDAPRSSIDRHTAILDRSSHRDPRSRRYLRLDAQLRVVAGLSDVVPDRQTGTYYIHKYRNPPAHARRAG